MGLLGFNLNAASQYLITGLQAASIHATKNPLSATHSSPPRSRVATTLTSALRSTLVAGCAPRLSTGFVGWPCRIARASCAAAAIR